MLRESNLSLVPLPEHITADSNIPKPNPVVVRFGLQRQPPELADAAAALGYIFTIVNRPSNATWHYYWLRLLVLYGNCLHLAFIVNHEDEKIAISGIPIMANVMYLADEENYDQSLRPAMFGASIPAPPLLLKYGGTKAANDSLVRARTWRRGQLLLPGLHRVLGSGAQLPLMTQDLRRLEEALSFLITQAPAPVKEGKARPLEDPVPEKSPLTDDFFLLTEDIEDDIKDRATPRGTKLSFRHCISADGTEIALRELLSRLLRRRYEVKTSVSSDPELNASFVEVLKFYITPHKWPGGIKKEDPNMKIPLLQSEKDRITQIIAGLWARPTFKAKAFAKLEYAIKRQAVNNDPRSQSNSGKCAETYPVVGVGQHYFPSQSGHVQHIKGFALEVRVIGNTDLFSKDGFSLATLRKIPAKYTGHFYSCSRYPCENCRAVLTLFGIPTSSVSEGTAAYDRDLHEAELQPW